MFTMNRQKHPQPFACSNNIAVQLHKNINYLFVFRIVIIIATRI